MQAVNFFFRQLMDLSLGGIVYDDRAALQYGGNFPSQREPSQGDVEVYLINRKEEEPQEEEMDAHILSGVQILRSLKSQG